MSLVDEVGRVIFMTQIHSSVSKGDFVCSCNNHSDLGTKYVAEQVIENLRANAEKRLKDHRVQSYIVAPLDSSRRKIIEAIFGKPDEK